MAASVYATPPPDLSGEETILSDASNSSQLSSSLNTNQTKTLKRSLSATSFVTNSITSTSSIIFSNNANNMTGLSSSSTLDVIQLDNSKKRRKQSTPIRISITNSLGNIIDEQQSKDDNQDQQFEKEQDRESFCDENLQQYEDEDQQQKLSVELIDVEQQEQQEKLDKLTRLDDDKQQIDQANDNEHELVNKDDSVMITSNQNSIPKIFLSNLSQLQSKLPTLSQFRLTLPNNLITENQKFSFRQFENSDLISRLYENNLYCDQCGMKFESEVKLGLHTLQEHGPRSFQFIPDTDVTINKNDKNNVPSNVNSNPDYNIKNNFNSSSTNNHINDNSVSLSLSNVSSGTLSSIISPMTTVPSILMKDDITTSFKIKEEPQNNDQDTDENSGQMHQEIDNNEQNIQINKHEDTSNEQKISMHEHQELTRQHSLLHQDQQIESLIHQQAQQQQQQQQQTQLQQDQEKTQQQSAHQHHRESEERGQITSNKNKPEDWLSLAAGLPFPFSTEAAAMLSASGYLSQIPLIGMPPPIPPFVSTANDGGLPRSNAPPPLRIFNPEAYCDLCNKEFCNKYFLKTHKANKHNIYESSITSNDMTATASQLNHLSQVLQLQHQQQTNHQLLQQNQAQHLIQQSQQTSEISHQSSVQLSQQSPPVNHQQLEQLPTIQIPQQKPSVNQQQFQQDSQREQDRQQSPQQQHQQQSQQLEHQQSDQFSEHDVTKLKMSKSPTISTSDLSVFCDICFKRFPNIFAMRRHQSKTHEIPPSSHSDKPLSLKIENKNSASASNSSIPLILPDGFREDFSIEQEDASFTPQPRKLSPTSIQQARESNFSIPKLLRLGVTNPEAFCDLCCKEYCNKYFLKTHKYKRHNILPIDDTKDEQYHQQNQQQSTIQRSPWQFVQTSPLNLMMGTAEQLTHYQNSKRNLELGELKRLSNEIGNSSVTSTAFEEYETTAKKLINFHEKNNNLENDSSSNHDESNNKSNDDRTSSTSSNLNQETDAISVDLQKLQSMILQLNDLNAQRAVMCNICGKEIENQYALHNHMLTEHSHISNDGGIVSISGGGTSGSNVNIGSSGGGGGGGGGGGSVVGSDKRSRSESPVNCSIDLFCKQCDKELPNPYALGQHLYEMHGIQPPLSNSPIRDGFLTPERPISGLSLSTTPFSSSGGGGGNDRRSSTITSSYCDICNKELCNKYFMKTHMQRMHGIEIENGAQIGGVICNICNKELCSKYFLRVHKHNTHGIIDESSPLPQPRQNGCSDTIDSESGVFQLDSSINTCDLNELNNRYFSHFTEICPLCSRRFRGSKWLRSHLHSDHGKLGIEKLREIEQQMGTSLSSTSSSTKSISPTLKIPNGSFNLTSSLIESNFLQHHKHSLTNIFGGNTVTGNSNSSSTNAGDESISVLTSTTAPNVNENTSPAAILPPVLSSSPLSSSSESVAIPLTTSSLTTTTLVPPSTLSLSSTSLSSLASSSLPSTSSTLASFGAATNVSDSTSKSKEYQCTFCTFSTSSYAFLVFHERSHAILTNTSGINNIVGCGNSTGNTGGIEGGGGGGGGIGNHQQLLKTNPSELAVSIAKDHQKNVQPNTVTQTSNMLVSEETTISTPATTPVPVPLTSQDSALSKQPNLLNSTLLELSCNKQQRPIVYAIPQLGNNDGDSCNSDSGGVISSDGGNGTSGIIMQSFLLEELPAKQKSDSGNSVDGSDVKDSKSSDESSKNRFVPSVVFLPVKEKISGQIIVSFTLTPA